MNVKMIDNNNNHRQSVDEQCSDCIITINFIFCLLLDCLMLAVLVAV